MGRLIVFEGLDHSGKTTHSLSVAERLGAYHTSFPNRESATGKLLDEYLKGYVELDVHVVHLLFSANRWEMVKTIKMTLLRGQDVVLDRYHYSGLAYSRAKGVLDSEWCEWPDKGLPEPDVVFFMDAPVDKIMTRSGFGDERYEKKEFMEKVREEFMLMMDDKWVIIDTTQPYSGAEDDILTTIFK